MWRSETFGEIPIEEVPVRLRTFYDRNIVYGEPMEITIGTDSQDHNGYTKYVSVISIICKRHGGIFFYKTYYKNSPHSIKEKLETETNISLETAEKLLNYLTAGDHTLYNNCPISIHIDAGNAKHGKTKDLIQSLTGWVYAMGFDCEVKPNSYAASTIADRISK